jgi:hypothetical protein
MHHNLLLHLQLLFDMDRINVMIDDMHPGTVILEDRAMDNIYPNHLLLEQVPINFLHKDKFV